MKLDIGKKSLFIGNGRQYGRILKIEKQQVTGMLLYFFPDFPQNDGFPTATNARDDFNQIAVIEFPDETDVPLSLNHLFAPYKASPRETSTATGQFTRSAIFCPLLLDSFTENRVFVHCYWTVLPRIAFLSSSRDECAWACRHAPRRPVGAPHPRKPGRRIATAIAGPKAARMAFGHSAAPKRPPTSVPAPMSEADKELSMFGYNDMVRQIYDLQLVGIVSPRIVVLSSVGKAREMIRA